MSSTHQDIRLVSAIRGDRKPVGLRTLGRHDLPVGRILALLASEIDEAPPEPTTDGDGLSEPIDRDDDQEDVA